MAATETNAGLVNTELVSKISGKKTSDQATVYLFGQKISQETLSDYLKFVNEAYRFFSAREPGSTLELTNDFIDQAEGQLDWRIEARNSLLEHIGINKGTNVGEITLYPTEDPKLIVRVETRDEKEAHFLQFKT